MSETPMEPIPAPKPIERIPRRRQSLWPVIVALGLFVAIAVGTVALMLTSRTGKEPWRISYPGTEWMRGEDANTKEGKRYLQAEVRFDQDVVSASDFEGFLAELVKHTKNVYVYYHIRAQNKRNQHVLDGVADQSGQFSITPGPDYQDQ